MERDEDHIALLRKYTLQFFPGARPRDVIIRYKIDSDRHFIPADDTLPDNQDVHRASSENSTVEETNPEIPPYVRTIFFKEEGKLT